MIIILPDSLGDAVRVNATDLRVRPSWLSPMTAMNVRYAIDSRSDDEVVAVRMPDAMAAISARSIAGRKPRVTVRVLPNSRPPKGIPAAVRQGVDRWLFPSERMRVLYPADLKDAVVEPLIDTDFDGHPVHDPHARHYAWVGAIDGNTERLKKAINWVNSLDDDAALSIYGTGKARNVMPAVKLSRSIEHPERIKWIGQPLTAANIAGPMTAIIQAGLDPTPLELRLQSEGIPVVVCG